MVWQLSSKVWWRVLSCKYVWFRLLLDINNRIKLIRKAKILSFWIVRTQLKPRAMYRIRILIIRMELVVIAVFIFVSSFIYFLQHVVIDFTLSQIVKFIIRAFISSFRVGIGKNCSIRFLVHIQVDHNLRFINGQSKGNERCNMSDPVTPVFGSSC